MRQATSSSTCTGQLMRLSKLTRPMRLPQSPSATRSIPEPQACTAMRYPAFLMGVAASIDWDRIDGAITTAFKAQSGLTANVQVKDDAANLIANGMNFMGNYASRNDNFILFQNGQMFGQWSWIDTYLNATWLNNALQVQILSGLELGAGRAVYRGWLYPHPRMGSGCGRPCAHEWCH